LKWKTGSYRIFNRTSAGFLIIAAAKAANAHDFIAHRLSTLRHADRLVVLDEGVVAEVGTHLELLKSLRYT
jgi:ABC-type multidrug transport system fused ATPase/permease subunit